MLGSLPGRVWATRLSAMSRSSTSARLSAASRAGLSELPVRNRLMRRLFGLRDADALPFRLTPRRVYILPSRAGLAFMGLMTGMLLGSVNYGLAMGYLFTFLLLGLLSATLFATWRNLTGLTIQAVDSEPTFAGTTLGFVFHLAEAEGRPRQAIGLCAAGTGPVFAAIGAGEHAQVRLEIPTKVRGRLPLGVVRIHSEYPLGLFHAWALFEPEIAGVVWPRPAGPHPLPSDTGRETGSGGGNRRGAEDFDGLRNYAHGEPPSRIAWKTLARHAEPLVKRFQASHGGELWLDFATLARLDPEVRLSQLASWVLAAERNGRPYGLRLPGQTIPVGLGLAHRNRCLTALALV